MSKLLKTGFCLRLPDLRTHVWRRSARFLFDRVELRDASDGLVGNRGSLGTMDVDELAPDMGHASDLADITRAIEVFEPGITIRMHPALVLCEVIFGMLPFAIRRELMPARRRHITAPWSFIPAIGPEPRCRRFACAGGQHFDGRVVCKDRLSRQNMAANGIRQRFQKRGRFAHPIGQR